MDVAIERYMDVLERVLKKGTARPLLPDKLTVSWLTGYYVQDERYIAIEHMDVRRDCVSFARPKIG